MPDSLVGWLYGCPVVTLTPTANYRLTLDWAKDGIERWGRGSRVLSVSLPLGTPLGPRDMRGLDFFENLLPEGPALATMAALAGVPAADTYGILAEFGRDCAGAVSLLPDGERPDEGDALGGYLPMSADDLAEVIADLDAAPLAAQPEQGFRPSLAGYQRKALLGRAEDGGWQRPRGSAPSTWILKPDGQHAMAANEATCLALASACDLEVPETELLHVGGRPVLAVRRYDRSGRPDSPARIHQEDGCQALGVPPAMKYEQQGGPTLRALATLMRDFGDSADMTNLLRRATFNAAVGNADAHAKNFSILHFPTDPVVRLAPLYDVLSTLALQLTSPAGTPLTADPRMGQRIGGQTDVRMVTVADLVDEASAWGIRRATASSVVTETIERVLSSVTAVPGDERVLAVIRQQATAVGGRGS